MLASRFTLLEQTATTELLPLLAQRGIALVAGGVLNSGFLADPRLGAMYDYRPTKDVSLVNRAQRIRDICARRGVPLIAAALQFPALNPIVASIVVGAGSVSHARELVDMFRLPVPPALWRELAASGLVADAG
jgi:D-threo-aldose 1-dehydrogenase